MSARTVAKLRAEHKISGRVFPDGCHLHHPGVPALAKPFKSGGKPGEPPLLNWNWECLPKDFGRLGHEALVVARAEPHLTAVHVIGSAEIWATPAELYTESAPNQRKIAGLDKLYRRVVLLEVKWNPPISPGSKGALVQLATPGLGYHTSLTVVFATLAVIAGGIVILVQRRRRRLSPARVAFLFGSATVAFVTVASILLEHGENNRFRFLIEALTLVLTVAAVAAVVRARRTRDDQQGSTTRGSRPRASTAGAEDADVPELLVPAPGPREP
ncbi:MAG TPA: hypothetical protein VIB48_18230 [Acidimicrobiia bacterium]|jgi:hypothetical protein